MQEDSARSSLKAQKPAKVYQKEFLQAATMLEAVAKVASQLNSQNLYKRAAAAYMMANRPLQAAACHEAAQEWTKACHIYRKADRFDEALRLLRAHPPRELAWLAITEVAVRSGGHIDPKEADLTLQTTRIHLVKSNELKKTGELFEDTDGERVHRFSIIQNRTELKQCAEQLEWLEDYGTASVLRPGHFRCSWLIPHHQASTLLAWRY